MQLYAQGALRFAWLLGQSSCSNNPHRGGRNRSVGCARCAPAVRPLRARWPFRGLRATPKDPGRSTTPGAVAATLSPPLESSCPNNPHRSARNWSMGPDSKATLVRPQDARRPSKRLQSDSKGSSRRHKSDARTHVGRPPVARRSPLDSQLGSRAERIGCQPNCPT